MFHQAAWRVSRQTPAKVLGQAAWRVSRQTSGRVFGQAAWRVCGQTSGRLFGQAAWRVCRQTPGKSFEPAACGVCHKSSHQARRSCQQTSWAPEVAWFLEGPGTWNGLGWLPAVWRAPWAQAWARQRPCDLFSLVPSPPFPAHVLTQGSAAPPPLLVFPCFHTNLQLTARYRLEHTHHEALHNTLK